MTTNSSFALLLSLLFCATACDGAEEDTDAGVRRDAGGTRDAGREVDAGRDAGNPDEDAGSEEEDAGVDAGPVPSAPPVITLVEWTAVPGCVDGTRSDVAITVSVTDSDTAPGSLTFSGTVSSCTGSISSANATVSCPNFAAYNGRVTVTDPEGNSDMVMFTFGPCQTGEVEP